MTRISLAPEATSVPRDCVLLNAELGDLMKNSTFSQIFVLLQAQGHGAFFLFGERGGY